MTGKNPAQVVLEGEWSLERADDLQKALAATLQDLLQVEERPEVVELAMSELSEIDVCGCQLLAVFLENLRRHGLTPVTRSVTETVSEKIRQLGFEAAVQAAPAGMATL